MTSQDITRAQTRRLSRLLSTADGTLTLALLQKLALGRPADATPAPPQADGKSVGVWRRDGEQYLRDPGRREEWRFWADLDRLPLTPGRRRVAVLGESAARGYFFDPAFSFAGILGDMLRTAAPQTDVLDLARTNANFHDLEKALVEAATLGPDALVVFAGNNWNNIDLTPDQMQLLAEALREHGYAAAGLLFQDFVVERAGRTLDLLASVAARIGAPVSLVVPEFNLVDWTDERSLVCPVLPGDAGAEWLRSRDRLVAELDQGHHEDGLRLARKLTELDGGTSPVSQRLLARAAAACGDTATWEQALIQAKDTVVGLFTTHSPRILAAVQDEMRRKAGRHGFLLADLPQRLRAAGAGLPDRRFFLDYCHLTFEGLTVAAAAVAEGLAAALGGTAPTVDSLTAAVGQPTPEQAAVAHFLAAVHNAHYGQPGEILQYHIDRALQADPAVAARLQDYLDYQTRTAPHWMCASYERSAELPQFARYLVVGDTRLAGKLADHVLRDAIVSGLARAGVEVAEQYEKLLIAEQADEVVDLLADGARAGSFRERLGSGIGTRAAFLLSPDLTSEFHLVVDHPADTDLSITWRIPAGQGAAAEVTLSVNGHACTTAALGSAWEKTSITVPAAVLRRGRNTVRIDWPLPVATGDGQLAAGAACLERGELPQSLPAYGHVFEFIARRPALAEVS
jgi:hypothetical protein